MSKYFIIIYILYIHIIEIYPRRPERSVLDEDPCLDAQQVSDLNSVLFSKKYSHLKRPWMREDFKPKIFYSKGIDYQWSWVKSLPVRGLNPTNTIEDVIRWMDSLNCSFLAVGEAVWRTVQRGRPVSVSAETSCSLQKLYSACLDKFQASSCGLYPLPSTKSVVYRLEIGDATANSSIDVVRAEPLKLFDWGSILGQSPEHLSYSVESMAIHDNQAGKIKLIDLTGRGYSDTCERKISAGNEESWDAWAYNNSAKLYEFYRLRAQGFSVSNSAFQNFVNEEIKRNWDKKTAQTFYCEVMLGGIISWAGERLTTACHVVYPDQSHVQRITQAKEIMEHEMGFLYKSQMGPAIDDIEAIYLTSKTYVETRNKLLHRIPTGIVPTLSNTELIEGKPMVNDISEVHRRPILSKAEVDEELPREYPSKTVYNLSPDPHGGFVEQAEGAGYNDPIAYDSSDGDSERDEDEKDVDDSVYADSNNDNVRFAEYKVPASEAIVKDKYPPAKVNLCVSSTIIFAISKTLLVWL
ncbi:unnamed protein product [Auanema sp. JU1783]|nr:unnamed protein product [Auanema sp. JU1783]